MIQFHPVWASKLTPKQKSELLHAAEQLPHSSSQYSAVLFRGKYKKNGGLVATVFLRNEMSQSLDIQKIKVEILEEHTVIAKGIFSPNIRINSASVYPWSFVFSPEMVFQSHSNPQNWHVYIDM